MRLPRSNRLLTTLAAVTLAAGGAAWSGCNDDDAEEAGNTAKEALEEAGQKGENALKKGEERLNEAEKQAEDALNGGSGY